MAHVKTTVDLPDELLVAAKQRAAAERTTLRALVARGLRQVLSSGPAPADPSIEWVTSDGGLPPGLDLRSRAAMRDWMQAES